MNPQIYNYHMEIKQKKQNFLAGLANFFEET